MLRICVVLIGLGVVGCAPQAPPRSSPRSEALVDVGTAHLRRGELEDAGAAFSLALELVPTAESLDGLGCVQFLSGNLLQAERFFRSALELDPTYSRAMSNLALLYEVKGETSLAKELYQEALKREGEDFRLRNNFAALLHDKEKTDEDSAHLLRQARALAPHPIIQRNLKHLLGER